MAAADSRGGCSTAGECEAGKNRVCLGTPAQLAGDTPGLPLDLISACQPALNTLSLPSRCGFKAGKCLCWGRALIPGNLCIRACETLALLESKSSWLKAQYIKPSSASIEILGLCLSLGAFHSSELLVRLRTAHCRVSLGDVSPMSIWKLVLAAFPDQFRGIFTELWCDHARDRSHSRRSAARGAVLSIRGCKQAAIVGWSYKYQAIMEAVLMKEMTCHYSC